MNIKETPWEKRNLGVESSVEFYIESEDCISTLSTSVLENRDYKYQVTHIPVGKVDILNEFLQHGFYFAETKIELIADLKKFSLSPAFERFSSLLDYHRVNKEELDMIYAKMRDGIFDTDKIALDPCFDAHIAGNRYALWTKDEILAGICSVYIVTQNDDRIGFFVLKKVNDRIGDSFLAGLFDKNYNVGLGFSVLYFPMEEAKRLNFKKIITGVSSNNPDSVKMHLALGYQIRAMNYTLVKHI